MNESWVYAGEGGKHVLFSSESVHREAHQQLLRVRRDDIIGVSDSESIGSSVQVRYLQEVIKPLLGSYFDVPDTIEISLEDARSLAQTALQSGRIPESRLPSWSKTKPVNEVISSNPSIQATLLHDYRRFHVPCDNLRRTGSSHAHGVGNPTWCVEIKPKAGYLAFSPLVDPRHRCKFKQSRVSIQQQLLVLGITQKGWNKGSIHNPTQYNPIDMFAATNDPAKIEKELNALFKNPQNNLKVWYNDDVRVTHGIDKLSRDETSKLISALATILNHESILGKLLRIQRLDIIDADGAVAIYNRLIDLCDGNKDLVDESVDTLPDNIITENLTISGCLKDSPFPRPHSPSLDQLVQEVERFSFKTSTPTEMDQAHDRCHNLVEGLSKSDCVYLLQNWLLSLTMCDVSIMISIKPVKNAKSVMTGDFGCQWTCSQGQDERRHGILKSDDGDEWCYLVKVVDCDNKPVSKLAKREEKEALIRQLFDQQ